MGFSDIKWGGFATIMVDTSTMSIGDKVRVKSIKTGQNYDKTVATVGTPLIWETEIYKDYVKICMVQTISDVETEIGGVYRECDYGQTLFIDDVFDKSTLRSIQNILNAHNEADILNIGDRVDIEYGGNPWTMLIGAIDLYDSHEVIFVSDKILSVANFDTNTTASTKFYNSSTMRNYVLSFYDAIGVNDKQYIKKMAKSGRISSQNATSPSWGGFEDYVWIPNRKEIDGDNLDDPDVPKHQFPIFVTSANRIKNYNGNAKEWFTCDGVYSDGQATRRSYNVSTNGSVSTYYFNSQYGILPCFRLTADS